MRSIGLTAAAVVVALAIGTGSASAAESAVSIDGGKAPLYGTLAVPDAMRRGPGVLIIAGSGPTDRDGDSAAGGAKPESYRLIAQALTEAGIGSLRFDKRGAGQSRAAAPPEAELRFSSVVDDAVGFAKLLAGQPGVTCVVLLGHSEGALVAAMVAQKVPVCGLIAVEGAGRPLGAVIRDQLRPQLPAALMAQADKALADLEAGRTTASVPGLEMLFRPSVQPYLISEVSLDPAAELKAVKAPVLILQGDRDIQVSVEDARLLAAARPDATLVIVPGMNHVLKEAPADREGNLATYADPTLPLAPGVMAAIIPFVKAAKP